MRKPLLVTIFFLTVAAFLSNKANSQSGVIFLLNMSKDDIDYYNSRGAKENRDVDAMFTYLRDDFGASVSYVSKENDELFRSTRSIRSIVGVGWEIGTLKRDIGAIGRIPMKVAFKFCDNTNLVYDFTININGYTYDLMMAILRALRKNINKDEILEKISSIKLNEGSEIVDSKTLKDWENNLSNDSKSIFGVYKLISSSNFTPLNQIAIYSRNGQPIIVNIESSAYKDDWIIGQIIGKLEKTSSSKYFIGKYKAIIGDEEDISIMYDDNIIELTFTKNKNVRKFIKIK